MNVNTADATTSAHSTDRPPLRGVLPVFQTPYHADESIDFETLQHEIDWLYERGVDGVVMAMVSEVLRLSTEERRQVAETVCRASAGRGTVIVSVGAESSHTAERLARHAEDAGASAIMAIPPVSIGLDDDEQLRYFERLFHAVDIPVVVQDASGYVGRPMSISLLVRMLDRFGDRAYFKPEASPIGPRLSQLRDATGGRARVFEGSGGIALVDSFRRGVAGTMPGADLIHAIVPLWHALEADDEETIDRISLPLVSLVAVQTGLDGFLAVEKHLLVKQGVLHNTLVRGPVGYRLDDETGREIDRLFELLMQAVDPS